MTTKMQVKILTEIMGVSVSHIAREVGYSPTHIGRYLQGDLSVSDDFESALGSYLNDFYYKVKNLQNGGIINGIQCL